MFQVGFGTGMLSKTILLHLDDKMKSKVAKYPGINIMGVYIQRPERLYLRTVNRNMCLVGSNVNWYVINSIIRFMLNRSMAMNIRLKITFRFLTNGIFLYEGYQNDLLLYFRKFFNTEYLTVSDFLSSKKIETGMVYG